MTSFRIGSRAVGDGAPVLVVAELSANHGGKLEIALETIEEAAKCGADAIKIQTYTPDTLTLRSSSARFVVRTNNEWSGRTLHDLYAEAMTPWEWHAALRDCARANGLLFFSTPFDATAVEFLDNLDVPAHKIASFELIDLPLVERVARSGKPLIISTGMASLGEIEAAVRTCRAAGNNQIALLRCVSAYPAQPESMALASIEVLRSFGVVVGLSDHTREPTAAIAAVALGAKVLEKHFILRRDVGGPDAFFSLEPDELKRTVEAVRTTEAAVGHPRFGPAPDEVPSLAFRRSLFVARDVPAGKVLDADDIRSVRPSGGLPPRHLPEVLGKTAGRALTAGEPLTWDALSSSAAHPAEVAGVEAAALDEADQLAVEKVELRDRGDGTSEIVLDVELHHLAAEKLTRILFATQREAQRRGIVRLEARRLAPEGPTVRAFRAAGFYGFTSEGPDHERVRCERRLVAFP